MKIRWEGESVKLRQDLGISVASQLTPILTFCSASSVPLPRKRGKGPSNTAADKYTPSLARSAGQGVSLVTAIKAEATTRGLLSSD